MTPSPIDKATADAYEALIEQVSALRAKLGIAEEALEMISTPRTITVNVAETGQKETISYIDSSWCQSIAEKALEKIRQVP